MNQREWSPTYARVSFGRPEDSARIKDYKVSVSDDGVRWQVARTGAMPSARGTQFIDIGQQNTRYIKLDVLNTWGGPQAPRYFGELQIDEIKVGNGYPLSQRAKTPLEAENASLKGVARRQICVACSGVSQVIGLGGGARNSVTYNTVQAAGDQRLELHTTSAEATSLTVTVNGVATEVAIPADRPDVPSDTAVSVPLKAGENTISLSSNASRGPGIDRISIAPLPPAQYTPTTTMTVEPHGVQWVGPGQQAIKVTAKLRLDVDDQLNNVELTPTAPEGWSVQGPPATVQTLRLGQILSGEWTLTGPAQAATAPVTAKFHVLNRAKQVTTTVDIKPRPTDRVFMREAEDSRNDFGSTGLTGCGPCSGGEKVRNIGGSPDAFVQFDDVTVDTAGQYKLYIDFTVNGPRSYFVSVNGGQPTEVKVDGVGNNTPYVTTIPVTLNAGANSIKFFNDQSGAPDLDRISLG
ncbi:NEW3 domain-containing protein [Kibdelosporangium philippinense]|uniref:NEW3 domain-containing protein n=1 Tax=Kibdelosporangium philippinense TaxID=211113 RepID=A0ABS8Z7U7_9PSEU|nr:CBM35 domain-containing protein [Kibdelosporangium philippinense]MCE7001902.1 NEW3 domain-containing protein [Kibdelosporangium philippinense]